MAIVTEAEKLNILSHYIHCMRKRYGGMIDATPEQVHARVKLDGFGKTVDWLYGEFERQYGIWT